MLIAHSTRRIALNDDNHEKREDKLTHTLMDFNNFETLAKIFITPAT